jgi:hypothetical protein
VRLLFDLSALTYSDVLAILFLGSVAGVIAYLVGRDRGREQGFQEAEERQRERERHERGQRRWEEVKKARAEGREPDWETLLRDG